MNDAFISIQGLVSPRTIKKLYAKLAIKEPAENELVLFVGFSGFDLPLGFKFFHLIDISNPNAKHYDCYGELKFVTQQWALPFDLGIPKGHKTVCTIAFDAPSRQLIRAIVPTTDIWGIPNLILLSNNDTDGWNEYYTSTSPEIGAK